MGIFNFKKKKENTLSPDEYYYKIKLLIETIYEKQQISEGRDRFIQTIFSKIRGNFNDAINFNSSEEIDVVVANIAGSLPNSINWNKVLSDMNSCIASAEKYYNYKIEDDKISSIIALIRKYAKDEM